MDKFVTDVFDILLKILPSDWGKIVLHVAIGNNNQSLVFFVMDKLSSKYYSFLDMQKMGIFSKFEFQNVSMKIVQISKEYQKTFEKEWTGYTLVIMRDGKNYVDFEFEQQFSAIPSGWDKKYLS